MYVHRYVCQVIDEMREAIKNLNIVTIPISRRHLNALIEEMQTLVNSMEASLHDKRDLRKAHKELRELQGQIEKAKQELKDNGGKLPEKTHKTLREFNIGED